MWQKLANIYNGTFKGMSVGIPPSDLLDMWQRKIDMLNGFAKKNEVKGIHMQPEQRLSYDLSILVNKYDSYLRWKDRKYLKLRKKQKNHRILSVNQLVILTYPKIVRLIQMIFQAWWMIFLDRR